MSLNRLSPLDIPSKPLLIVLSGLSGAGKDAVLNRLKQSGYPLTFIVTVTTRTRRQSEKDGIDYHFTTTEKFQKMIEHNELLEWANVYGNFYGVPRSPVKQALDSGNDVIVKVDVQGAATIKKLAPGGVFIFLTPPTVEQTVRRLQGRNTESDGDLELRVRTAEAELKQLPLFDYIVVNRQGEIERAVDEIKAIITAEKRRVKPREIAL